MNGIEVPLNIKQEVDRERLKEVQENAARTVAPAPPRQPHDPRWPDQEIVKLHDPYPRGPGGGPPEIDSRSEADRLRDPANMLRRIDALERENAEIRREVAEIKSHLQRYFGASAEEGQVWQGRRP